ncbi:alginate O-acetylation protein [Eubacterium sp. CAG:274]|nr:alginate O-acetylation protein [Eubacterium sp. CAG:274]
MLFNSLTFIIFLAVVLVLYYTLPQKLKWIMLLIASCIFYMGWRAELIILIVISTLSNWLLARLIYDKQEKKKVFLIISLIINFGLLFVFKYMVFINHSFMWLYNYLGWTYPIKDFDIVLPMGISFYTFQAASYTIDVFYGKYKPEKNYFKLALFIMFFPQLVAGPIERADRLLGQLFTKHKLELANISQGSKLMLMGYFKKIVIADRVSVLVDAIYNSPQEYKGLPLVVATLFFTVQIYCDFSGYTDIARGVAKLMGIDLMINFDRPYFSKNIKEFWRRWHISLSSWLRDYIYIPLGGSRCSLIKKYRNIIITFLASGLWHGANWTFVLWGGLHGLYQVIGDLKNKIIPIKRDFFVLNIFRVIICFVLVAFAWIFFRANTISDAVYIIKNIFAGWENVSDLQYLYVTFNNMGLKLFEIVILSIAILFLIFTEVISFKYDIHKLLNKGPFIFRFVYYYILACFILMMGVFAGGGQFIYFQF